MRMNPYVFAVAIVVLLVLGGLFIYTDFTTTHQKFLSGTVIEIGGTLPHLDSSNGALFGNESVKIGDPTYMLHVQCSDGIYTVQIENCGGGPQTIYNLCFSVKIGTQVKFLKEKESFFWKDEYFSEGKIGTIGSNQIKLI